MFQNLTYTMFGVKNNLVVIWRIFGKFSVTTHFLDCIHSKDTNQEWPRIFQKSLKSQPNSFLHRTNSAFQNLEHLVKILKYFYYKNFQHRTCEEKLIFKNELSPEDGTLFVMWKVNQT